MGISLGPNPRQPGAIFFYSFKTGRVKSRIRFRTEIGLTATAELGTNPYHIKGESINTNFTTYLRMKNTEEVANYFASVSDKYDIGTLEGSGKTKPIGPPFMNPADQPIALEEPISLTPEKGEVEVEAQMMALQLTDAVVMAARSSVTSTNISWKKASNRAGDLGRKAKEAINKELKQIVLEYDVCTPVAKDVLVDNCHLSHCLYDEAKDKALNSFLAKIPGDAPTSLDQISEILNVINEVLSNPEAALPDDPVDRVKKLSG